MISRARIASYRMLGPRLIGHGLRRDTFSRESYGVAVNDGRMQWLVLMLWPF